MLSDKLAVLDAVIAETNPNDGEPVAAKPHQRYIGLVDTTFKGIPVRTGVQPYLLYILGRADDILDCLDEQQQVKLRSALNTRGLEAALPGKRGYRVDRRNHIEVWARPG
jgi:hypothetical protein